MHVLIAGTARLEAEIERALDWARLYGGIDVERATADGATIAMASSGGPMAQIHRRDNATVMSLGLHPVRNLDDLLAGRVPNGTVAIAVAPGKQLVASGEGNQRLFRVRHSKGTLVSTHVGALVAALGDAAVLDRSYEDFLLGFGFLPDGRTAFEGIQALARPSITELGTAESVPLSSAPPAPDQSDETSDLAELVCEIVDEQAGAAKQVGVLLGGFDSALVAAALHRTGREVHTFTFSFSEPGFGQQNIDAAVAAAHATHHWVTFTPDAMGQALLDLPARLNQPSPQPHYQIQTIIAAETARSSGMEAIFTGDGCDALFAAYPTINTRAAANSSLRKLPAFIRRSGLSVLSAEVLENQLGHVARVGRSSLRASLLEGAASQHLPTQYLDDVALGRLRLEEGPPQMESISQIRMRLADASAQQGPARLAVDGNALTGQSQSKVEGVLARTGLKVSSPFTHPRFRAAVAALRHDEQLPSGKLRGAEGKPVLQEAAERAGLLPSEVIYQKKQSPTEAPVDQWYAGPLRSTVFELLADLPFDVNEAYVNEILRPTRAEDLYRRKVAISRHTLQAIGLLASYASFTRLAP